MKISLTRRGAGSTNATEAPSPAALAFFATFIEKVRDDVRSQPEKFATLEGTLRMHQGKPRFRLSVPAAIRHEPPVSDDAGRTSLRVELDPESFENGDALPQADRRLVLPEKPDNAHFLEVDAELTVGGESEAALGDSPPLDVPLAGQAMYRVKLVDETEAPIAGVELTFRTGDAVDKVTTDGSGRAELSGPRRSSAVVSVASATIWPSKLGHLQPADRQIVRPSSEPFVVTSPRILQSGVPAAPDSELEIMVVARFRLVHPSLSTPWREMELGSEGPWDLRTVKQDKVTQVGARAEAGERRLLVVKPAESTAAEQSADSWLNVSADDLHDALVGAHFNKVFDLLAEIPLEPGATSTVEELDGSEAAALDQAIAEVAAEGTVNSAGGGEQI